MPIILVYGMVFASQTFHLSKISVVGLVPLPCAVYKPCVVYKMPSQCLTSMTHTLYEMPEQHFPVYKHLFNYIKWTTSISFQSRLDTWNYFCSIQAYLPFIKWGLAEAFYSDKGSPFHKGMYEGYLRGGTWEVPAVKATCWRPKAPHALYCQQTCSY